MCLTLISISFQWDSAASVSQSVRREHTWPLLREIASPMVKGDKHQVGLSVRAGPYYRRWPVKYHIAFEHAQQNDAIWEDVTPHPWVTSSWHSRRGRVIMQRCLPACLSACLPLSPSLPLSLPPSTHSSDGHLCTGRGILSDNGSALKREVRQILCSFPPLLALTLSRCAWSRILKGQVL